MSLEFIPKGFRAPILLALGAAGGLGGGAVVDARIESKAAKAADAAVNAKWTEVYQQEALKACTTAADAGAYRAVTEAMQQMVLPMQRAIDAHFAAQQEHERNDATRIERIERRVGLR